MTYADTPPLTDATVRLEPLDHRHATDLADASREGELWRTWYTTIPAPEMVEAEIDRRRQAQARGELAPWAVVDARTDRAVGMTTYMALDEPNQRLEIGSTWIGVAAQGTGINPAMKRLLLGRAFDELGCNAVELRTHWHNHQSRAAIARLGAKQDGVLRHHVVWRDGTLRDTVVFSIVASEWPAVRAGLDARIGRRNAP